MWPYLIQEMFKYGHKKTNLIFIGHDFYYG
jgi:hypothetical protein